MDCHVSLRKFVVKVAVPLAALFSHFLIIASHLLNSGSQGGGYAPQPMGQEKRWIPGLHSRFW